MEKGEKIKQFIAANQRREELSLELNAVKNEFEELQKKSILDFVSERNTIEPTKPNKPSKPSFPIAFLGLGFLFFLIIAILVSVCIVIVLMFIRGGIGLTILAFVLSWGFMGLLSGAILLLIKLVEKIKDINKDFYADKRNYKSYPVREMEYKKAHKHWEEENVRLKAEYQNRTTQELPTRIQEIKKEIKKAISGGKI